MLKCTGQTKGGKNCTKSAQPNKKFCKIHDKDYKDAKKADSLEKKAKSCKTLEYIALKIGSARLKEGDTEDELVKSIKAHTDQVISGYVQKEIIPQIKELAILEYDCYGYPKRETPFVRKFWMMLSWHLVDDVQTYTNTAMTCKGLYKVFVQDKVRYYVHPLKGEITSPMLFFRPVFRVLSIEIPTDFDELLDVMGLPTVEDFMTVYEDDYGKTNNEVILLRRRSDAINELLKQLVHATLEPEQVIEETIKGAGLFEEYDKRATFRFYKDFAYRYKLFKRGKTTYVMVDTVEDKSLERKLLDSLCPYDGKFLLKLMRIH